MNNKLEIFCDGGSRGNPGPAASAYCVYLGEREICKDSRLLGIATNNIAEYTALYLAVNWIKENKFFLNENNIKEIEIFLDSELVTKQIRGEYKVKNINLRELFLNIKSLENIIEQKIFYKHIRREKNKIADALVNNCLDRQSSRAAAK